MADLREELQRGLAGRYAIERELGPERFLREIKLAARLQHDGGAAGGGPVPAIAAGGRHRLREHADG